MQNEPQLSAEIPSDEEVSNLTTEPFSFVEYFKNVKGIYSHNDVKEIVEKAVKDERKKVIEEVESWLVDEEYPITDPDSIDYGMMLASPKNEWNEELRAKLNQLKEEGK